MPHAPLGVRRRHHRTLAGHVPLEDEREQTYFKSDLEDDGGAAHDVLRELDFPDKQSYNQWLGEQETFSELVAKQKELNIDKNKIVKKINLN